MRSIPAAMTWEILARSRWRLPAAALAVIGMPALIVMALQLEGPLDPQDPSMLMLHVVMIPINAIIFGFAVFTVQGRMSQLYAYPVPTTAIVAWRLLPGMALVALQTLLFIAMLNTMFELEWPLWGPALFAGVAFAAVEAVVWLTEKSIAWLLVATTLVVAVFGLWFESRYGSLFAEPMRLWRQITLADVFTMLLMAAAAYGVAVLAVARNRRGELPLSLGIVEWLALYLAPALARSVPLNTPAQAQGWFEWRRKGWIMPAVVGVVMVVGLTLWLFARRDPGELFLAFLGGGGLLWLPALLAGLVMGNAGPNDSNFAMGNFLSTRPMTDTDMARTILRTAAKSVLLAWGIWATAFLLVCVVFVTAGVGHVLQLPENMNWSYFLVTLLGPWIVVGTLTSVGLIGRSRLVFQVVGGLAASYIGLMLVSELALTAAAQRLFRVSLVIIVGGVLLLGTAWVFATAWRRSLIQASTVWTAAGVWAAIGVLLFFQWPVKPQPQPLLSVCLLVGGILALAVAPFAAAPLALWWNRHR